MTSQKEALKKLLVDRRETVATAESCTGGRVASYLTSISGASEYFLGGIISYNNEVKKNILKAPAEILKEKGAVSLETVFYMAKGAIDALDADWSMVSSGVVGPLGGSEKNPVGLVWMAIGSKTREPICWNECFQGDRISIMDQAVLSLVNRLISTLISLE